jgi:hypothetical protein
MKNKSLKSIFLLMTVLVIAGCGKDGTGPSPETVTLDKTVFTVPSTGTSQTVKLTSTRAWTLDGYTTDIQQWITIAPVSGEASDTPQVISITVKPNEGIERSATITLKCETKTTSLTINQEAFYPETTDISAKEFNKTSAYKYQRYRLSGRVKNLSDKTKGVFELLDATGTVSIDGLTSNKDITYGTITNDFGSTGIVERDTITVIGYQTITDGKARLSFAFLEEKKAYTEPDPDKETTVLFPYSADFTKGTNGFVINNKVFPLVFDYIWSSSTNGMIANTYRNDGKKYSTESWLYSPFIDLKDAKKPLLVFKHIVDYFESMDMAKDQTSLWIREQSGSWRQVAISFSYPETMGETPFESEDINLSEYLGKKIQIAFKYLSDENHEAGKWQITNLSFKENEEPTQSDNSDGTQDYNKPGWNWNK